MCSFFRSGTFVCMLLVAAGCDVFSDHAEDEGRIVLGQSIDGITVGADTLAVRRTLGPPSRIERGAGFVSYQYSTGRHAGMNVHFGLDVNRHLDGLTTIAVYAPYAGKTASGIGIGSPRERVLGTLGEPSFSNVGSAGNIHDRYEAGDVRSGLLYDRDGLLLSITMSGPH